MISLFTKITFETIYIFFASGFMCGTLYYITWVTMSRLFSFLSKAAIEPNVACRGEKAKDFLRICNNSQSNTEVYDLLRSIFILLSGVIFVLLNYIFLDGITRSYTSLSFLLGLGLSKIIVKNKIGSAIINLFFFFFKFILLLLLYPIKLIYCIIAKKRRKTTALRQHG